MTYRPEDVDPLLTPAEVAHMFKVDARTVTRWAKKGLIPCRYTLGGHRRYRREDVEQAFLRGVVWRQP